MRRFYGWRVVAGAFTMAVFGWGLGFYGPPVYLQTVHALRGWTLALVSSAVTVHFLVGAVVVANLPALHRRFGIPTITKVGTISSAVGVFGWAMAPSPVLLLVAAALSGCGWGTMSGAAINAIISPWFVRTRPAALSMAYNGASIGGVVFSPLWVAAIAAFGFPTAAAVLGIAAVMTMWILADTLFAREPQAMGLTPDGDAPVTAAAPRATVDHPRLPGTLLWQDRRFLTLAIGMALGLFAQIGMISHLFSLLVPALGAPLSGIAMGMATASAIAGRTLVGWLMPAGSDRRVVACASYVVQIAGTALLFVAAGANVPVIFAGVLLFGVGIGNATSLPPLIAQSEFAREDVGRVVALIVAIGQAGYAFAPAAFGLVREFFPHEGGAAPEVFIAASVIQALATVAFLMGRVGQRAGASSLMPR